MSLSIIISKDRDPVATHLVNPSTGRAYTVSRVRNAPDPRTLIDPDTCASYIFDAVGYVPSHDLEVPDNIGLQMFSMFLEFESAPEALRRTQRTLNEDYPDRGLIIDTMTIHDERAARRMEMVCCAKDTLGHPRDLMRDLVSWMDRSVWRVTPEDAPQTAHTYIASSPAQAVAHHHYDEIHQAGPDIGHSVD